MNKILSAICSLPAFFHQTPQPKLIMTLLVKNEEELLPFNLEFHRSMGVDGFIITDNNSTDSTPKIIEEYKRRGWVLEVIEEHATDYNQKAWVDRMICLAREKYGADWVINADADEFWYSPKGSLKTELSQTRANVLRCNVCNVYPEQDHPWTEWDKTVRAVPADAAFGLSPYSIFTHQTHKVMHRTAGYLQISMGNHKVKMLPRHTSASSIIVYHYNIRDKAHFLAKMINGGKQLEQRKSKHGGRHWRYFYDLYKQGSLEEEYARVVGSNIQEELTRKGYIVQDNPLPECFKRISLKPCSDVRPTICR